MMRTKDLSETSDSPMSVREVAVTQVLGSKQIIILELQPIQNAPFLEFLDVYFFVDSFVCFLRIALSCYS